MRSRFSILFALLMLLGVSVPAVAAPPDNPFVGSWHAYDARDGGVMHLRIGADLHIVGSDTISTICRVFFDDHSLEMRASTSSFGHIDNGKLVSEGAEYFCYPNGPGGRVSAGTDWPPLRLVFNPANDTLTWEGFGFEFYRTGKASTPTQDVRVSEETWEFENNPCTGDSGFVLNVTLTYRDIIFTEGPGGKVVTTVSAEITGPDAWSGRGTQTVVQHNDEKKLSWQFVATDAETGQKVRFHANDRYPDTGGPDLEPPFGFFCIRP